MCEKRTRRQERTVVASSFVFITKKNNNNESKQLYFCEHTHNILGIYQHHRRVDYVVRHAGRLDRAKDVPESRLRGRRQEIAGVLADCSIRLGEQNSRLRTRQRSPLFPRRFKRNARTVSGKHRVFEVVDDEGEEKNYLKFIELKIKELQSADEGSAAISVRRHQNRHPKRPRKTRFVRTFEKSRRIVASYLELEASQNGGQRRKICPKKFTTSNGGFEQALTSRRRPNR